jgi:hypothetical protein
MLMRRLVMMQLSQCLLWQRLLVQKFLLLLLVTKGVYGLLQLRLTCSFLLDLLLHDLGSLHCCPSSLHMLLLEP